MRHAKASQHAETDSARELTDRGRAEATALGAWLAGEAGFVPDAALVSAAVRTRLTWELLVEAGGFTAEASYEESLQSAGADSVLDLVRLTPDNVSSLLVVGHNPTVSYLAQLLDAGNGDEEAMHMMIGGFPPGAVALFEYDGAWSDLQMATARLTAFRPGATE